MLSRTYINCVHVIQEAAVDQYFSSSNQIQRQIRYSGINICSIINFFPNMRTNFKKNFSYVKFLRSLCFLCLYCFNQCLRNCACWRSSNKDWYEVSTSLKSMLGVQKACGFFGWIFFFLKRRLF